MSLRAMSLGAMSPCVTSSRGVFRLMLLAVVSVVVFAGPVDARPARSPFADLFSLAPWMPQTARKPAVRSRSAVRRAEWEHELYRELHRMPPRTAEAAAAPRARVMDLPLPLKRPPKLAAGLAARLAERTETSDKIPASAVAPGREADSKLQPGLQPVMRPPDAVPEELACAERLAKVAHYRPLPRRVVDAPCAVVDLVQLDRVIMPDRSTVTLTPAPTLRCGMAEALVDWVRSDVADAAAELGGPLAAITDDDSYHCRSRNNVAGAKLSEHGKGNAIDITAVKLHGGRVFRLTDRTVAKAFRERVRATACERFTTVLGPGDPYHADHIHLDLAARSNGYRICQWDVLEPTEVAAGVPLPPRKPAPLTAKGEEPRPRP